MADLGTSGGLQGIYQGDIAQNRPAYIKPAPKTFGDDIVDFVDKQEKKKKDEEDAFNKQLDPFISIDGTKYLPHRVPLIKEQSQKVLQEAMKVRGKKGNVMLDENVNREVTKLQELQSKYGRESAYTKEIATKLNGDAKYEYTEDFRKDIGKAIEGTIDPEKYVSSEMADEAQTFYKYGTPKAQTELFEFMTPQAEREVILEVMQPNGTYKETVTKGSQIYNTPEGQESQYQKFLEFTKNGQDPHAKYFLKQATKQINDNDNLAFQESLKSLTPLEAQEFVAQEAAKLMLEGAMVTNKLKTADKTTKIPTGFNFTNNFQSTGGGGAIGKIWTVGDPIDQPLYETTAEGKPIIEKPLVKNGKFFSIELVAGAENPKNIFIKGYSNAAIVGLTRDEDTGKVEYATIEIPEKKGREGRIIPAEKKYVKIGAEDISSIRNNIGAGQYDVSIGKWEKPKEKAKKETPKAAVPKTTPKVYKKGEVQGGYEFLGGDPKVAKNWKKI
jgi:hypothetical protein